MTDPTNIIPNSRPVGLPYGPGAMSQKSQMMPSGPLPPNVRANFPLSSHAQPAPPSYSPSAPSVNGMNGPVVPPLRPVYAPPRPNPTNMNTTSLPNAMQQPQQTSDFQRFPLPGPYPSGEMASVPGFNGPQNVMLPRPRGALSNSPIRPIGPPVAGMSPNTHGMRPTISSEFRAPGVNSIHPVPPGQFQGPVPPVSGPIPPRGPPPSTGYMPPRPPVPLAQPTGPPPMTAQIAPGTVMPPSASDRPTELPVPYHGHGQYSHQVGATMKLTAGITPNTSEPPSQKSSRSSTPLGSGSYDALEGQFSPNVQSPSQYRPQNTGQPFPGQNYQHPGQYGSPVSLPSGPPTSSSQPPHPGSLPPLPGQVRQPPMSGPPPLNNSNFYNSSAPPQPPSHIGPPGPPNFISPHPPPPHGTSAPSSVDALTWPPMPGVGVSPIKQSYQNMPTYPGSVPPPMGGTGLASAPPQAGYPNVQTSMPPQPMYGQQQGANTFGSVSSGLGNITLQDTSMTVDLLQQRSLIPPTGMETPRVTLPHDYKGANCNPHVFRCTLNAIPQTSGLLNKARLPLGIIIHPFKDLSQLPVIQSSVIVRCRSCRTYINPFVHFADTRRWKCNLCYRINELPDEFSYDPVSKTHGDPQRRPEIRSATIEFIAPSEYMLRPPQPAVYLYLLDVSFNAVETGYLSVFCETMLEELDKLPGDSRTQVGFIAYDKALHFFNLSEGLSQPQMLIVSDIEEIFLPCPDNLLVNLHESRQLILDLLTQLPGMFEENKVTGSAMGAALQAAYKLMSSTGGRVTVMQTCLPTVGPGALAAREDPNMRSAKEITNLGPATDFYKKLALDFSAQQVAVDLFMFNGQYADVSSLGCISKYSAGCVYYYPSFHSLRNVPLRDKFETDLHRYLLRKIGFEAVMRIRCTKGLSIHTFHGNFFVRSTDLLSLPNINPDAGFGMQMSIEENLGDLPNVCFQAALLYTSSKGERRIRVHTLCIPVTNQLNEVFVQADQQAIISLLAKMAVDRSVTSSMSDARDALVNAAVDAVTAYSNTLASSQRIGTLPCAFTLRLIPLFVLSLMKSVGFRTGSSTKLDDRVFALEQCKTLPVKYLLQLVYPYLYPIHELTDENGIVREDVTIPQPPLLQLSSSQISRQGAFLMDTGEAVTILVGSAVSSQWCQDVLGASEFSALPDNMLELPELDNPTSERVRLFLSYLLDQRPNGTTLLILRDDSKQRHLFFEHMIEDRTESAMSYYEFLQHIQKQLKS